MPGRIDINNELKRNNIQLHKPDENYILQLNMYTERDRKKYIDVLNILNNFLDLRSRHTPGITNIVNSLESIDDIVSKYGEIDNRHTNTPSNEDIISIRELFIEKIEDLYFRFKPILFRLFNDDDDDDDDDLYD